MSSVVELLDDPSFVRNHERLESDLVHKASFSSGEDWYRAYVALTGLDTQRRIKEQEKHQLYWMVKEGVSQEESDAQLAVMAPKLTMKAVLELEPACVQEQLIRIACARVQNVESFQQASHRYARMMSGLRSAETFVTQESMKRGYTVDFLHRLGDALTAAVLEPHVRYDAPQFEEFDPDDFLWD